MAQILTHPLATGCRIGRQSGRVEDGCLFDEISNLVEPTERLHMDVQAGPQRGRRPERRGQSHASVTRV